jgi:hypothetical protein
MISDSLKLFAKLFTVIIAVFMVSFYLLVIFLEPALFYFTPEGVNATTVNFSTLTVWLLNIPVRVYTGLNLGTIFFGLWIVFAVSFVAAWKLRKSLPTVLKESAAKPARKLFSNCLFAMPIINSMTLIAVIVLQSIQEVGGVPTGTSPVHGDAFMVLFELSYSAVVEEIGFRLIPIGAFLILYLLIIRKKEVAFSFGQKIKLFFAALMFPDTAKRMVGAKTVAEHGFRGGVSLGEWGVVVFTAAIFGLAHYNPGVSWEIGKISSAAFTGLVIGLVYLVYGFQSSIIMHWFFNVYASTYVLLSDTYAITLPFANAVWIITLAVGILGWVAVANLGALKLIKAIEKRDKNKQNQATLSPSVSPL